MARAGSGGGTERAGTPVIEGGGSAIGRSEAGGATWCRAIASGTRAMISRLCSSDSARARGVRLDQAHEVLARRGRVSRRRREGDQRGVDELRVREGASLEERVERGDRCTDPFAGSRPQTLEDGIASDLQRVRPRARLDV